MINGLLERKYIGQDGQFKKISILNTAIGSYRVATNWKDTLSYQLTTRYSVTEKIDLLSSIIYETNVAPLETNAIGYPLANIITYRGSLHMGESGAKRVIYKS
jgi:long-subunit fatty acid transport protein